MIWYEYHTVQVSVMPLPVHPVSHGSWKAAINTYIRLDVNSYMILLPLHCYAWRISIFFCTLQYQVRRAYVFQMYLGPHAVLSPICTGVMLTLAGTVVSVLNEVIIPLFPVRWILLLDSIFTTPCNRAMMNRSVTSEWSFRVLQSSLVWYWVGCWIWPKHTSTYACYI